ncbi:hypothetical protein M9Y10_023604 [Tritrichomonas musculus]|uniref:Surface antigen BspA-like n=1 Tax=Tritrichomonas musculus TaxID=1915356 RepID=A0ABR2KVL2_9EUKA
MTRLFFGYLESSKIPKTIKIIGMRAFLRSNIGSTLIPAHVKKIREGAFSGCRQHSRVEFEPNSELQTIEKEAFKGTCLANIRIPASSVELNDGWCIGAFKLNQVEVENGNARYLSIGGEIIIGKSDTANNYCDNFVFCTRDTVNVKIQKTIKIIRAYAFSCSKLKRILIPAHITQIGRSAFSECRQLTRVDIEPNSKLRTIEEHVFSETKLFKIFIPAYVTQIYVKGAFFDCKKLDRVEIEPNSELKKIESYAFYCSNISRILVRVHVTQICDCSFGDCKQLFRVEFEPNSELQTIERDAFVHSKLKNIIIPARVTKIDESAFESCSQLLIVEIENSMDESIIMNSFSSCKIVMFPVQKNLH